MSAGQVGPNSGVASLGSAVTSSSLTSVGTLVSLDVSGNSTLGSSTTANTLTVNGSIIQNNNSSETTYTDKSLPPADSGFYVRNGNGTTGTYSALGVVVSSTTAASDQSFSIVAQAQASGLVPKVAFTQRDGNNSQNETMVFSPTGQVFINRTAQHASSSERLSVNGMTSIQFDSTSSAALYIFNEETTTTGDPIQPFIFCHDGSGIRAGLGVQRSTGYTTLNGQFGLSLATGASGVGGDSRLFITSTGKVGINITDNTTADLHVRTGSNGAGIFRVGGGTGGATGLDIDYSNSGTTKTIIKQNYRSTNADAELSLDSGFITFMTGTTGNDERLRISEKGTITFGPEILEESFHNDTGGGIQSNYNHDILTYGEIFYGVTNAVADFTFNVRGNSTTTFNDITTTGKTTTVTVYVTANSKYMTEFRIDGTNQTGIKWAGGSAPSSGSSSGVDVYSFTIMKTAANTYHVFGNVTNFA